MFIEKLNIIEKMINIFHFRLGKIFKNFVEVLRIVSEKKLFKNFLKLVQKFPEFSREFSRMLVIFGVSGGYRILVADMKRGRVSRRIEEVSSVEIWESFLKSWREIRGKCYKLLMKFWWIFEEMFGKFSVKIR